METKRRKLRSKRKSWDPSCVEYKSLVKNPYKPLAVSGERKTSGSQITDSENHRKDPSGVYRDGGPFYTTKFTTNPLPSVSSGKLERKNLEGLVSEGLKWSSAPILFPEAAEKLFNATSVPEVSKDTWWLDEYGATAIARCAPANPVGELGVGASELYREGLPFLPGIPAWKQRTSVAKAAGSEYLNQQFGWNPLISEIRQFCSVVNRQSKVLRQYYRDAGRNVRRSYRFPLEEEETILSESEGRATLAGVTSTLMEEGSPGKITITRRISKKRWFEGAFTYTVPDQSDSWSKVLGYGTQADIVYGASLNPELLWNLTPWSWAVDWFSNTGDVISNISNYIRAGQVLRYGYMMEETKASVRMSMSSSGWKKVPSAPKSIEKYRVTKVRRPANPFGFGMAEADLSPTQLAIAAALGITLLL